MFVWSDGSVKELKRTILHNMAMAPGMDGDLKPEDVDAVAAYVWAITCMGLLCAHFQTLPMKYSSNQA